MPQPPEKRRKTGPEYRTEFPTYLEALRGLARDGYEEVEHDGRTESLEDHLDRLEQEGIDPEQRVRLEPAGESLRPYLGSWLREEPDHAVPPEELDFPPVLHIHRVRLEGGEADYLDEHPFVRVRRYAEGAAGGA